MEVDNELRILQAIAEEERQRRRDDASLERRINALEMAGGREIERYFGHIPDPNKDACGVCGLHGLFWSRHARPPVPCPAHRG